MRALGEARARWDETLKHTGSLADLQRAVRYNGPSSPCVSGCRSLCWKIFLLFQDIRSSEWSKALAESREDYSRQSEHFLRFIKHPEELANVAIDPLADDPDSPWNTLRQDEIIRAEIAQDVQRLPDEPFYHEEPTQTTIVDALFVYCKLHPNDGGYRQGMHELLAPIVYVLYQDALDRQHATVEASDDAAMLETLDSSYIEHDAFTLFSKIMGRAKAFYEVKDSITRSALASASREQAETSAIVEKSKFIHEVCLAKVDPELSRHLKDVEILPQIFLIRWIRLLLGREFPFDQLLVLWDALFAVDSTLDLIDLVCIAMLIRIRWSLLEADYSHCLQLLLKYPAPEEHHGPHTFVDDAVYLKSHLNASGGASLIMKYTGRLPSAAPSGSGRPRTPSINSQPSHQRIRISRSPLSSPGKFIQQQGGMEAIFQGAAKNVLERGEKLGINQAVRDAMGEIRRNVQGFNDVRYSPRTPRQMLADDSATRAIASLERRNRLLAGMLDESIVNLKSLATSDMKDKSKALELVEMVAAKVQFVKVHLEDSTIDVPEVEPLSPPHDQQGGDVVMKESTEEKVMSPEASGVEPSAHAISTLNITDPNDVRTPELKTTAPTPPDTFSDAMEISQETTLYPTEAHAQTEGQQTDGSHDVKEHRPQAPIPTRSTLAQSSFSWMLEPDESISHSTTPSPLLSPVGPKAKEREKPASRNKRSSGNANRDRNAFLFGEVTTESDGTSQPSADDIFGMEPITKREEKGNVSL